MDKKPKIKTSDFGGQEIVRGENGKYYRAGDGLEVAYVEQAKEPKRMELVYKDLLHWYYKKNILYPRDKDINLDLYISGVRYQQLYHKSHYSQKTTAVIEKDVSPCDLQDTLNAVNDAQTQIRNINRCLGNYHKIVVYVLIDNQAARKKLIKLREGLLTLRDYFN
tara:strand:+ start:932 stop:1426 length:495 start_codon:yes stop_codon:yes gene_type:complete